MLKRIFCRIKKLLRREEAEPYFPPDYDDQQSIAEGLWFVVRIVFIGAALWVVWRYFDV